ncbi:MAG: amino acid ABC transporter permease [Devosia sp.]|nr:amino acid ABC transporter permease [Devosia sp.]
MAVADAGKTGGPRGNWFYNPTVRSFAFQAVLIVVLVAFVAWLAHNTATNLTDRHIASGFGFLAQRSSFDIVTFLPLTADDSYGYALLAGLFDTIVVSVLGIIIATVVGVIVGIARLSTNWLIRSLATVYVETLRNIPPLLVILFWYLAVIATLPSPRDAITLGPDLSLSNRGFFMPRPVFGELFIWTVVAFVIGLIGAYGIKRWAQARQARTGQAFHTVWAGIACVAVVTLVAFVATGAPLTLDLPVKTRFNVSGGMTLSPEFTSLLLALSLYTASFIAEIVRAGILAVSHGQTEAARALGLRNSATLRLVILPQALRVIVPPLTSEYLNLIKNSSLGIASGFMELVAVGSAVLNPTGQAIEIVGIWMVFYLGLSIITSFGMNVFNQRIALKER